MKLNKKNICIYIDEKALLLTEENSSRPGFIQKKEPAGMEEVILELKAPMKAKGIVYRTSSLKKSWNKLLQLFTFIEAAGGLVKNTSGDVLFIFRQEKWDLPKGKMEKGESPEHCAVREVREECGVDKLQVMRSLPPTYHAYMLKGKPVLKKSHWFEMFCSEANELTPQLEEDITEARWIPVTKIKMTVLTNTYPSILELLSETLFKKTTKF